MSHPEHLKRPDATVTDREARVVSRKTLTIANDFMGHTGPTDDLWCKGPGTTTHSERA
jgi:hypothetical protein